MNFTLPAETSASGIVMHDSEHIPITLPVSTEELMHQLQSEAASLGTTLANAVKKQ